MARCTLRGSALLLGTLLAAACGATAAPEAAPAPRPTPGTAAELEAIYRARADSARLRFTEADVRFMTQMIHHHAQALEMARLAPTRAGNQEVRTLAARILSGQVDEIALMQRWLRERGQPVPHEGEMGHDPAHAGHAAPTAHPPEMPGMLTPEQLRALEAARGAEFDRLFLRAMIEHHRGAVQMVRELFATDGAGQDEEVFRLASDVQVDQQTEIARMERMLAQMR